MLPALALEFNTPSNSKSSLDRPGFSLNKTRPEFTQPDLRTPNPSPSPINNNASPAATPSPAVSPGIIPVAPASPLPGGVQDLGDRPIIPTINILPGANRPEFQVPDLRLPGSPTPSPSTSP